MTDEAERKMRDAQALIDLIRGWALRPGQSDTLEVRATRKEWAALAALLPEVER